MSGGGEGWEGDGRSLPCFPAPTTTKHTRESWVQRRPHLVHTCCAAWWSGASSAASLSFLASEASWAALTRGASREAAASRRT
jgi:hypothetical protein